jgi:hypothetical protein
MTWPRYFTGCWPGVGRFKSKMVEFQQTALQLKIFAGPLTVLDKICSTADDVLAAKLPGIGVHIEGLKVLKKLKETEEKALGVEVINTRFILSFVEELKVRQWVQAPHDDGAGTHEGLHVCAVGDAICSVEYVASEGRNAEVLKTTGGA